jgi:hypothetical protein
MTEQVVSIRSYRRHPPPICASRGEPGRFVENPAVAQRISANTSGWGRMAVLEKRFRFEPSGVNPSGVVPHLPARQPFSPLPPGGLLRPRATPFARLCAAVAVVVASWGPPNTRTHPNVRPGRTQAWAVTRAALPSVMVGRSGRVAGPEIASPGLRGDRLGGRGALGRLHPARRQPALGRCLVLHLDALTRPVRHTVASRSS